MKPNDEIISMSEFARRLGIGEKTIRDGIKKGKIKDGITTVNGKSKIKYSIALKEAQSIGLGAKIIGFNSVIHEPEATKKPVNKKPPKDPESDIEIHDIFDSDYENLPYNQALQKKENYIAGIKKLEFLEKKGTLVNKSDVYSQLFEFHQEIKKSLLAIPDRIVDTLLSFNGDRNKIHECINESIASELDKLKAYTDAI